MAAENLQKNPETAKISLQSYTIFAKRAYFGESLQILLIGGDIG
jgi:hypothetical protein